MFTDKLPATEPQARGTIRDGASCKLWIAQLQLTDIRAAQQALANELSCLNQFALPAAERLRVMELLRDTSVFVQGEYVKRMFGKPLPLSQPELAAFKSLITLWADMVTGYRHCLEQANPGNPELLQQRPLIGQRCLRFSGAQVIDYLRMRYEFPAELWQQLHGLYAYAEAQGFAGTQVAEPSTAGVSASSCRAVYVESLLACHANPFELTPKQLELAQRWLKEWSASVAVTTSPPQAEEKVPALAVFLKGAAGLQTIQQVTLSDATRYLDLSEISKAVRVKTILLQQGQTPEQLGLGRDCEQPGCGQLLARLHKLWCEGMPARSFERRASVNQAQVCYGLPGIWPTIAGKTFTQPHQKKKALGGPGYGPGGTHNTPRTQVTEDWAVKDESVLGMRMEREAAGERLQINQLISVKLASASWYQVAIVRWIVVSRGGTVQIGLRALPGTPQPVAARLGGPGVQSIEPYVEALLLPDVPSLNLPGSLILPRGWYLPEKIVELFHGETSRNVKLEMLVERGVDYERVSFSPA